MLKPDIRAYLEAENAYADTVLGHTEPLQKKLVAEMRGRIKEDDSSVPSPDGPFAYFQKYREGGQHEQIGRTARDGGEARFIIDGDELAKQSEYFRSAARVTRPTICSRHGARTFEVRNISPRRARLGNGHGLPRHRRGNRRRHGLGGGFEIRSSTSSWTTTHRPMQVYRHVLGTHQSDDTLVYEEKDSGWFTHIHESASRRFCVIAGGDHETSEQRLIDLSAPEASRA